MTGQPLPQEDLAQVLAQARISFEALRGSRLFVTGGTGFFGHWLLESLLHADRELGLDVRVCVLTRDPGSFQRRAPHLATLPNVQLWAGDIRTFAFPKEPHSHILHAATDTAAPSPDRPPYELAESILEGTRRVLQYARACGTTRLLYVSSGAVYGRSTAIPFTPETFVGGPDPLQLGSSYDEAKRMAEHLCIAYSQGTPLEPVIARCFAFIGPHLPLDGHFAIGNFIQSAIGGEGLHIKGDGTPRRSWLYMADLAAWLWTLLLRGQAGRAYNVGSDEAYTIAEAAALTSSVLRPDGSGCSPLALKIDRTPDPGAPLNSYVPAIDRARDELGLQVSVPLAEAIRRTAAWHGFPLQS